MEWTRRHLTRVSGPWALAMTLTTAACGSDDSDGSGDHASGAAGEAATPGSAGSDTGSSGDGGGGATSSAGGSAGDAGRETGGSGGSGGNATAGSGGEPTAGSPGSGGNATAGSSGAPPLPQACGQLPQPASGDPTRVVASAGELKAAVEGDASPGETVFVASGTYRVEPMAVTVPDLTIRSESGNRDDVTLDLDYTPNSFDNGSIFNVWASGITIAHLTLTHAYNHPIHVTGTDDGDTTDTLIYDLHIVDGREQQIKINTDGSGQHVPRRGRVACSLIELTDAGRANIADYGGYSSCYTGGVDGHSAFEWVIENNVFRGIYCEGREIDIAEHAVHLWSTSGDNLVQNNVIIDCSRGVGIGMGDATQPNTIVRNNLMFATSSFSGFDTGVELEGASDVSIVHNTMAGPITIGVNQRRDTDTGLVANNILTGSSHVVMGSSACDVSDNYSLTDTGIFASLDPSSPRFLRLASSASSDVVDTGLDLRATCPQDIDGDERDAQPDLGADELVP